MNDPKQTAVSSTTGTSGSSNVDVSIALLLAMALRRWKVILALPLIFAIFTALAVLLPARTYTSSVGFVPGAGSVGQSSLAGVAARFGISVPGQDPSRSPDLFVRLILSEPFLRRLATARYEVATNEGQRQGSLIEILEIEAADSAVSLFEAIEELRNSILDVSADLQTSIVTISASTEWRDLSVQIAERALAQVHEHNLATRQAQGEAERAFMSERTSAMAAELRQAEDELEVFMKSNREFRSDPRLVLVHDRLQRAVVMRQQMYTALSELLEQARIEAVRNTPSVVAVMLPVAALRPDRRRMILKVSLAMAVGLIIGCVVAWSVESVQAGISASKHDIAEVKSAWRSMLDEMRRKARQHG